MTFNTEWIPNAKFSGGAFSAGAADPNPLINVDTARLNDGDSIDDSSIASDDESNIARSAVDPLNETPGAIEHSTHSASPPAYRLEALPPGPPQNPIEIEDEEVDNKPRNNDKINGYERLNSPRYDPVKIIPFQATVIDEEEVLCA
ncbi:hypothetical protein PGT21_012552 [Puccinia graminis f. sp. tritici]|uniref:Uncharacterized protein n=1 Tax=Puccinia graminis f. sp. tritici TaxID=56615 RepID=A0A5B0P0E6_PUCGR|nr:hypothetical protein PGT21_012552 [Puccinia graminis f. sp. tritici]KAA1093840.1 hypothetical protein PGTUg99_031777 [Puccinia graminis f. sp. tritici]